MIIDAWLLSNGLQWLCVLKNFKNSAKATAVKPRKSFKMY